MKLPGDSLGVTDIISWQECPRKMSFGMQRHEQGGVEAPEAQSKVTSRYGSVFHDAVEYIEKKDATNEQAIKYVISHGHRWMDPEDIEALTEDLETYRAREPLGVRTVMVEQEIKVPLMRYRGQRVFFRGRIDRLYESLSNPGQFFHRDYKSSAWPASQAEVDEDLQFSAYNWALHELLPEIETLVQTYDQLRFGEINTTRTEEQRRKTHEWLQLMTMAVMDDEEYGPDGLLVPQFNRWCPWCPIMESCPVVPQLTNYAQAEIAKLAPQKKKGRKTEVDLDPESFDVYVEQLAKVSTAKGVLDRFEKAVKSRLKEMSPAERKKYGYRLQTRNVDVFSPEALRAAHGILGDEFYRAVSLSKAAIEGAVGSDKTKLALIVGMADKRPTAPFVIEEGSGKS